VEFVSVEADTLIVVSRKMGFFIFTYRGGVIMGCAGVMVLIKNLTLCSVVLYANFSTINSSY
jgi:hypothetical protein